MHDYCRLAYLNGRPVITSCAVLYLSSFLVTLAAIFASECFSCLTVAGVSAENGQVTLNGDDRKAEYQYQTCFDKLPQVWYGLCGFNFDLNAREKLIYNDYNYKPKLEPNALGVRINAFSSKTALTIEAFDLSFADSAVVTVDVCFQACTIGPGIGPVHH